MFSIDWQLAAAIATVFSSVAFAISAVAVMLQLRQMARERYFSVTAHLFEIWHSSEFQGDQLFLLHEMPSTDWQNFCTPGRGQRAERALHRVGGYYDRVGNLVLHNLIRKEEILPTIGGNAVAVWDRIEPLVKELRLRENAVLFQHYEALLPECHDCYVPARPAGTAPAVSETHGDSAGAVCAIEPGKVPRLEANGSGTAVASEVQPTVDSHAGVYQVATNFDTAEREQVVNFSLPDTEKITHRLSEFTAESAAVVVYYRGAWCPFCLRQLSDYGERYADFKRLGIEIVALSTEGWRKSRRMRSALKLPFTVLSDVSWDGARAFGLEVEKRFNIPATGTFLIDSQNRVRLRALDQSVKSLFARDMLEYARSLSRPNPGVPPRVEAAVKPGLLFLRAFMNMAIGVVSK
jgi:peroxiredoxin